MVKTEVKSLGAYEHEVHATLPQEEYDRVYRERLAQMRQQVRLPGFRPGKTPVHVIKKQFGGELHHQVTEELVRTHYATVVERSGLIPAVQPELGFPAVTPSSGFSFTLRVTTWPTVELDLPSTEVEKLEVTVEEGDIQDVVDRMMKNNCKFVEDADRAAQDDDELIIDFVGSVDGENFDGGTADGVRLILGEGRFIEGFEEQLRGAKAGDEVTLHVRFPDDYTAPHLAGKDAQFVVKVQQVGRSESLETEEELAEKVGFESGDAIRRDVRKRLESEAKKVCDDANRDAVIAAILAKDTPGLPEALVQDQIRFNVQRLRQQLKERDMPLDEEFFDDEMKQKMRESAERTILAGVVISALMSSGDLKVDEDDLQAELEEMVASYPEEERVAAIVNIRSDKEQMARIEERLVERGCIDYALMQMRV
ncbi:MAG: trigger factor, partial [Mariprofundales bacterium]|nr:trigger factor [Mariprofundales bacterium]